MSCHCLKINWFCCNLTKAGDHLNGEKFPIAPLYSGAISTRDTSPRRSRPSTLAPLFNFPLMQSPNPHITILQNQESSESRIFALVICIINTWSNPSTSCRACPTNAENLEMRPIPSKLSRAPPPTARSARLRRGAVARPPKTGLACRKCSEKWKRRWNIEWDGGFPLGKWVDAAAAWEFPGRDCEMESGPELSPGGILITFSRRRRRR